MIFLDTHALVFLASDHQRIPRPVWPILDASELYCSPMARLELDFLYEIGRIKEDPRTVMDVLMRDYGVQVETQGWARAAEIAATLSWTRDPFDRLITAHALVWGRPLLSRDSTIQSHYQHAFWDKAPTQI